MADKIIVKGVIFFGRKILLVKRSKEDRFQPDIHEFPGGSVREEEGLREALRRELLEEVGLKKINLADKFFEQKSRVADFVPGSFDNDAMIHTLYFLCQKKGWGRIKLSSEHSTWVLIRSKKHLLRLVVKGRVRFRDEETRILLQKFLPR